MQTIEVEVAAARAFVEVDSPQVVISPVLQGPIGPQGPTGPAAPTFTYTQATPAATWTVTHTLGRYPQSAEIVVNDQIVYSDIAFPDALTVVVTFASPQSGVLRLT